MKIQSSSFFQALSQAALDITGGSQALIVLQESSQARILGAAGPSLNVEVLPPGHPLSDWLSNVVRPTESSVPNHPCIESRMPDKKTGAMRTFCGFPFENPGQAQRGVLILILENESVLKPNQKTPLRVLAQSAANQLRLNSVEKDHEETKSEVQRLEEALNTSEAFYHSLVECLPQNILRKDLNERFTFANKHFCNNLGTTLNEILGKTDFDFFPEELARKYQQDDKRVIETQVPIDTVEAHKTHTGQTMFVHTLKTPIFDARGKVIGIQGIFWDVTKRKKTEEALAHERDLLRALLDNVPDAVYFKDAESRIIKCSKALAQKAGYDDPETLIGKTDFDLFSKQHAQKAFDDEQEIIRTGKPLVGITEMETWKDGRQSYILTSKLPFRNRHGSIIGTVGISKDITAMKKAERELARARDLAVESTRLKSEFLANVSHEVRTPLNGILGMNGLLLDTRLTEEQRDYASTIRVSAESLLTIINDILDFSKIEAGKLEIEMIDLDLREAVEGSVELLSEKAHQKNIELGYVVDHDLPDLFLGDPGRLRQILINLIGNAVKFTDQGDVVVSVRKESETKRHMTLHFEVRDSGIGMAPETIKKIFHSFTQADGSTTRKYGGTGLGLAITKQLVKLMQGQIGAKSELSKGSKFWFTIRLAKHPTGKLPSVEHRSDLFHLKILIVDDNETNRRILEHQTSLLKMKVSMAEDAAQALKLLDEAHQAGSPFELAVLDFQMPDMDGLQLAKQIKKDKRFRGLPLIMLTSLGQRPEDTRKLGDAISSILVKPVRQSRLYDSMANALFHKIDLGAKPPSLRKSAGAKSAPAAAHGLKILIAEDNCINQKVALTQLKKLGYQADAVGNGLEVMEAIRRIYYPVIFMDCQMPDMDGFEATQEIRGIEKKQRHPIASQRHYIIAMTANAQEGDREHCLSMGMDAYLSKPVRIQDLNAALQRFLKSAKKPASIETTVAPETKDRDGEPSADPANSSESAECIDLRILNELRELKEPDGDDPFTELIDLFLGDAPAKLGQMQDANAQGNYSKIAKLAHSLKGSANNLGAKSLAAACLNLEEAAKEEDKRSVSSGLENLSPIIDQVREALTEEKQK